MDLLEEVDAMKCYALAATVFGLALVGASPLGGQEPRPQRGWTDTSPHEVRSITVAPGVEMEVLDWGGAGEPLVFLAGLQLNAHTFDGFAPRFTDTHRVVGITRRGHGASSWPDSGYGLGRLVADIRGVLDSLGLERVTLAGHSMAGVEMTRLAADHPDRVSGLIYIDAAHDLTLIGELNVPELCPLGPEVLEAIGRRFEDLEAHRHTQYRWTEDGIRKPYVSEVGMEKLAGRFGTPDYAAVRAPALAVYHVPYRAEDVVGGVEISDACASALQRYVYEGIATFVEGMPRARIVAIQDGQHNLHLVAPDELETAMDEWFADPGAAR
jgi:pimeloyl-ACP methyl ester carboxylesterase